MVPSAKTPTPHSNGSLSPIPAGETKKHITISWLAGMRKPNEHISLEEIWLMRIYEDKLEKGTNIKVSADVSSGFNPLFASVALPPVFW